jgi:hypothetical protein
MTAASFLSPLWLAGLAAAWAGRGRAPAAARRGSFSLVPVTVLALIPFVLLVIAVQPGRGWARDWDVAIGMGVVATLATAAALASCWRGGDRHTLAPCSTVTLSIAFAMWGVHASEPVALGRVENLLRARPSWSDATRAQTLDFLGARALNAGHAADAARFFERSIECGPNPRLFYQLGLALFADGDLDRARAEFLRAAGLNPTVPEPWLGLTRVALAQRDTVAAIRYLDSTLARDPQHVEARQARASLSQQTR